jgi:broad specificity phosphatase PhoE
MSNNLPVAWLARHGETTWSLTGLTDPPPTECGKRTARRLGDRLRELTFAKVFTSPLQHTARTLTGTKDPQASDMLYINNLAAPFTGNTTPDAITGGGGGDCEDFLVRCYKAETNRKDSMHDNTNRASH